MKKHHKNIRLMKKAAKQTSLLLFVLLAWLGAAGRNCLSAQNTIPEEGFIVKGVVCDANSGKPIAAAQIQAQFNAASATTDDQGRFTIRLRNGEERLSVKAFDYSVREVAIRDHQNVTIELYPEVFSSYYQSMQGLTGKEQSVTMIPSAKVLNELRLPQAISPDEFIQSEMGGEVRSVYRSGVAGIGTSMFIRGLNSLNTNSQPLFIVDGVIWENGSDMESLHQGYYINPLTNIEIGDIESITVLKDGVSLYGSKASNGVILIKTNRGKSQVTKIDLNIMTGFNQKPDGLPVLNADQYREFASEIIGTAGLTKKEIAGYNFLKSDPSDPTYMRYHNKTDWSDEVYQTGKTQSYAINVNGGDERALYYFSLGYTGNEGLVKTTSMSRINTRFNADITLSRNLTTKLNVAYTTIDRVLLDDGVNALTSPTFVGMTKSPFMSPYVYTAYGSITTDYDDADELGIGNPAAIIDKSVNKSRQYRFNIGVTPEYSFGKNLKLSSQFDYSLMKNKESYFRPMQGTDPVYLEGYGYSQNMAANQLMRNISLFSDTRLDFKKQLNQDHLVKALAGWRLLSNYFETDFLSGHNTGSDNNTAVLLSYDYIKTDGINNRTRSISSYASVSYSYRDKYLLDVSASLDGSSRFGKETLDGIKMYGHSWALFPSVNAAWIASSESALKDLENIDLLKFRAGFGVTGNDGIQDYATKSYFQNTQYIDDGTGIVLANLGNESLQWETTKRWNGGVDFSILNERVNFSADIYAAHTSDLLTLKMLDKLSGLKAYWTNGGELSNKGFELSANVKVLNDKDIQCEIGMNVGRYKNRIESLPEGDQQLDLYGGTVLTRVGYPAGVFYGYKTRGVFATDAEAEAANLHIVNQNGSYSYFRAGDIEFKDFQTDNVINDNDRQIIGDPNPDFYGSFSGKISYKKVTFNALFTYSYGNDVYNYLRRELESGSDLSNQTTAQLSRWRTDGQLTNQPKAVMGDPMGNSRFSDRWIEDGSYLRLKTLSLTYRIPINNTFINGLNLWVAANNLLTWTNYLGVDPECSAGYSVLSQGIDAGLLPQTRSFFVGVKVNL